MARAQKMDCTGSLRVVVIEGSWTANLLAYTYLWECVIFMSRRGH